MSGSSRSEIVCLTEERRVLFDHSPLIFQTPLTAKGLGGALPITAEQLREISSGDLFGMSLDLGMGWPADAVNHDGVLILTTNGGIRGADGGVIALGYHTGHWELGLLAGLVANEVTSLGMKPFAGHVSDPCDGRTNGTPGMMDSLGWRNSATAVFNRLVRSMPRRKAVVMVAGCDKAVPAARMVLGSLARNLKLPGILLPGGSSLESADGAENNGLVQSSSTRFNHGQISLEHAQENCGTTCASPGGSCQFMGSGNTGQGEAEAAGLCVPHSAWAPSGSAAWADAGSRSAATIHKMVRDGMGVDQIITDAAVVNMMTFHAAIGGSTNSTLHIPAFARSAGLRVPTIDDWRAASQRTPRIVNTLPSGPHAVSRAYFAGGVPEVVLQLAEANVWDTSCKVVGGQTWEQVLQWWKGSERRKRFQALLYGHTGIAPNDIIMSVAEARASVEFGPTMSFPTGNLMPQGSICKSTAIQVELRPNGIFSGDFRARVFTSERAAMAAIKSSGDDRLKPGDVIFLVGLGLLGAGMPEIFQVTGALKYTNGLETIPVVTDARFSGVSTGACVGHVGPEARAGGPVSKLKDGDWVRILIDGNKSIGSIDLIGDADTHEAERAPAVGDRILMDRAGFFNVEQGPNMNLPDEIVNMALSATMSGGIWRGAYEDPAAMRAAYDLWQASQATHA